MTRLGVSLCLLLTATACGSSQSTDRAALATDSPPPVSADAPPAAPETTDETTDASAEPALPTVQVGTAPIELPSALLYKGYVVGGLPNKAQIDAALDANIESALSLMARDEPGISVIGPYAASRGFRYIRFTIAGPEDLTESMAWEFAATLPLIDTGGIVHSAEGKRVAAIFALKAFFVDEVSATEALAIGLALGMGELEGHVRALLELPPS